VQSDYAIAVTAFWIGVVAAASLPLGALTSRFWAPEERTVAGLMAFGGGALLAALSVDLVAPALAHGHYYEIAFGAIIGGLIFVLLNEAVNDYGGFVRKVSTSVYHLRRQKHQRYRNMLSRLKDLDLFGEVEQRDFRAVAAFMEVRQYAPNMPIYHEGDPSDGLYILARGEVRLFDPTQGMARLRDVQAWETFARLAFLTGAPHEDVAVAARDSEVWFISRERFLHLLVSSPRLAQAIHSWLRSAETLDYLVGCHGLNEAAAINWLDGAVRDLIRHGTVPRVRTVDHNQQGFIEMAPRLKRSKLLVDIPPGEIAAVAERLIYKHHHTGEALFHDGEIADRLYIIDRGEVSLLDTRDPTHSREILSPGCVFGTLGCISGARHTTAAVAAEDTSYWVLRRCDLPKLLHQAPVLRSQFGHLLHDQAMGGYLRSRHGLDPDKTRRWLSRVDADLDRSRPLTAIADMLGGIKGHQSAALAIWLGILLDGIPESLVLGTIQAKESISLSLIAGLFISNYPEALSSSIGMRHEGLGFGRVLLMWSSLVLITGTGAALGALFFGNVSPGNFSIIEGIAAGAMLTMIAQTMLPEAYLKGGNVVGLATLMGFLTALFFRELG